MEGLGDSVANKIVLRREEHPYKSVVDFETRSGVNKTLFKKMKELKILDNLKPEHEEGEFETFFDL